MYSIFKIYYFCYSKVNAFDLNNIDKLFQISNQKQKTLKPFKSIPNYIRNL